MYEAEEGESEGRREEDGSEDEGGSEGRILQKTVLIFVYDAVSLKSFIWL